MLLTKAQIVCNKCGFAGRTWGTISRHQTTLWAKDNGWHTKYDADICPKCWENGKRFDQ